MGPRRFHRLQYPRFAHNVCTRNSGLSHDHCHDRYGVCASQGDQSHLLSYSSLSRKHNGTDEQLLCMLCETGQLLQASALLSHFETPLHHSSYISLLQACIACKAPACARQVYTHLTQYSNGITPSLGDYLAVAFSKCGDIDDASHIFHGLTHRTVLSWTAMIHALMECGCSGEALQMLYFIHDDGVKMDSYIFVSLLKACVRINDLRQGKRLHALAHERGFTSNVFVGNSLVSMYGKCGDVLAAEVVFSALTKRSIVSWNAMLNTFMEDGQIDNALSLYRQMLEELMDPGQLALVFALQACSRLANEKEKLLFSEIGMALHSLARMGCFESDMFVGTALINLYGKCGAIREAEHCFTALSEQDVVSWNAMLSLYIQQNQEEKALKLYREMFSQGLSPDQHTYVFVFQACGYFADKDDTGNAEKHFVCERALEIGKILHCDACRQGFSFSLAVANSLISMYGRHRATIEAENVFISMSERDTLSWSMMLSAYVDLGSGKKALRLYRQMQEEIVIIDQHVLVLVLQACVALSQDLNVLTAEGVSNKVFFLDLGQALLIDAKKKGVYLDAYVGNALINFFGKCVGLMEAQDIFNSLCDREIVSWTTMLSAYVDCGEAQKALQLYTVMHEEQLPPNQLTFVIALRACRILIDNEKALAAKGRLTKLKALEIVQALHVDAHRGGFTTDALVRSTLVTIYGKCGNIVEAESLFQNSFHQDVAAWSAMLSAYLECGQAESALCLHKVMQKQHVPINDAALKNLLHACNDTANLEVCRELHFYVTSGGYVTDCPSATALICAYGSFASTEEVQAVFDEVLGPDMASWTACIASHTGLGNVCSSAVLFERSRLAGLEPDDAILGSILSDCSSRGYVNEALHYCLSFRKNFGVNLNLRHYGSLIDFLGRAGDFRRIESILFWIPMQADLSIWLTLLGACQIHGNLELATWAFGHALLLEPIEASIYVLMSNICTNTGLKEGAGESEYHGICLQHYNSSLLM